MGITAHLTRLRDLIPHGTGCLLFGFIYHAILRVPAPALPQNPILL